VMYKYYSYLRPIAPLTYPKENLISFQNYEKKEYVKAINRAAWGELIYSEKLSEETLKEYELLE
ncbi:hypothetical protein, partial [Fusobacterium necrophorum]